MSQQYKPVPCKGCGKPIVFEKLDDGKWLVSEFDVDEGEKLGKHNCPNYKPKPKPFIASDKVVGGVVTDAWTGTTKQGQMFEARVHKELDTTAQANNELILKMLTDINRNVLEILGLLQDQFIKKQHNTIEEATSQNIEKKQEEDDYGF